MGFAFVFLNFSQKSPKKRPGERIQITYLVGQSIGL
jgi:hypothetical protein